MQATHGITLLNQQLFDRRNWGVCWTEVRWAILHLQQRFSAMERTEHFETNFHEWAEMQLLQNVFKMNFCFKMQPSNALHGTTEAAPHSSSKEAPSGRPICRESLADLEKGHGKTYEKHLQ